MERGYQEFTKEEKNTLWEAHKNGDTKAREQLISANYGLVGSIAKKLNYQNSDYEELFQSGVMGLIQAVDRYEYGEAASFSTYAFSYIYGEMMRQRERSLGVRRQRKKEILRNTIKKAVDHFHGTHHREPTCRELSEICGIPYDCIIEVLESDGPVESLSQWEGEDTLSSQHFQNIENKIFLEELLKGVGEKQRKIIEERYFQNKTQQQISDSLSLSQTQISRLERGALMELRKLAKL